MNDFDGLLGTDYGFKPQGKSAPMAASKGSSGAATGSLNFDLESRGTPRSTRNYNSFGGSFKGDGDSIFGSSGNRKTQDTDGFGDLFGGSARYTSKSESRGADSPFNLDSMYRGSSDTGSKYTSSPPVFDKPLYDDDIFEGVTGLKSSGAAKYEDVFASVASEKEPSSANAGGGGDNSAFDDLLGGFGKVERQSKGAGGKKADKDEKGVLGFDDLLPGFGSIRSSTGRPTSDATMSSDASAGSAKRTSTVEDDPFKVFESVSTPQDPSSAQFGDPLEEISKLSSSGSRKFDSPSVSNGKLFEDVDPFGGLGKSVPTFSSDRNNRKDRSPPRTARTSSMKGSTEKSSIRSPERRSQNKTHADHGHDFYQGSLNNSTFSSKDSNVNVEINPEYVENLESNDDVWLVVSEIPLFTQPTAAPPPSRPPPARPVQVPKSVSSSTANMSARRKVQEHPFPSSTQYAHVPKSAPAAVRVSTASPFDDDEDHAMAGSHGNDDEHTKNVAGEELNSVAAAMKEAMDRAEAKFRHAKEVRERESTKGSRRENVQLERDEKALQEEREKQERLEQEQLQKEREEKEREEKEKEQKRLERERERARELEREREKARLAVERATREARERAAAEARARAERVAVEKANAEARQRAERAAVQRAQAEARERAAAEAKERAEKAAAEARERANAEKDKEAREKAAAAARAETEARIRAERAAVERAAAEARERAATEARERAAAAAAKMNQQKNENDIESFFSMNSRPSSAPRPRTNSSDSLFDNPFQSRQEPNAAKRSAETFSSMRKASSSVNIVDDLSSIFGAAPSSGEFQEVEGESEERRKARLERHQRAHERAAKALAEKNERDLQTQREQAERHRIGETLDMEIKRWSAGKEGNLRALLATLQYVLWPECGWQPVSLTDLITGAAVKKAYRKATLCIHPDKVQQKGATLQQKYIAEKVFDLLKEAWNKFNSEELF